MLMTAFPYRLSGIFFFSVLHHPSTITKKNFFVLNHPLSTICFSRESSDQKIRTLSLDLSLEEIPKNMSRQNVSHSVLSIANSPMESCSVQSQKGTLSKRSSVDSGINVYQGEANKRSSLDGVLLCTPRLSRYVGMLS